MTRGPKPLSKKVQNMEAAKKWLSWHGFRFEMPAGSKTIKAVRDGMKVSLYMLPQKNGKTYFRFFATLDGKRIRRPQALRVIEGGKPLCFEEVCYE